MHVTCPHCSARYAVDPVAIGPTGRTVECARCHHRWFEKSGMASPETAHPAASAAAVHHVAAHSSEGASQPSAYDNTPPPRGRGGTWLAVMLGLILLMGISAFAYRKEIREQLPAEWQAILTWQTLRTLVSPSADSP